MNVRKGVVGLVLAAGLLSLADPSWAACDKKKETSTPTSRYMLKGNEVFDTITKLTWQRCSLGQTWQEGKGCTGTVQQVNWDQQKALGGDGWRVPTKDELTTLASPACMNPAVNEEVFPGMDPDMLYYWTSEPLRPETAWYVDFYEGVARGFHRSHTQAIRLVRDVK